jgi:hypothetical protein
MTAHSHESVEIQDSRFVAKISQTASRYPVVLKRLLPLHKQISS